jgi:asparagine synthase (glutamine-hydrolysing)
MFAFALLDKHERKVHLVRDPLGIKPLYYYTADERVIFASEVQALLDSGQVPRRIKAEAVSHFLSYGWVGKSDTAISGIQLLQPGHVMTVDLSGENMKWTVSTYEPQVGADRIGDGDRTESTGHLFHLLEQSVKCHLVSDVPVGLFLSGGIDSTAILHLMRQAGCNAPKTFTVAFPETDFSESEFARRVAQRYDAEHHEIHLAESDLFDQLPAALAAMDQPTMDGVNTFVIAKAVRSAGVKVALSGLGSDELFAGYPSFRRARWARMAAKVPSSARAIIAKGGRIVRNDGTYDKFWDLLESDGTPVSAYRISRQLFRSSQIDALAPGQAPRAEIQQVALSEDEINEVSRLEMRGYMTDLLLRDTDFMSMASSLEVRVPFVDKVVVRYALQLPGRWKIARKIPKVLLLDAMRGTVPRYVWKRRKMGFVFPFERWMRSTLREQVEETLGNAVLAEAVGLAPAAVQMVWQRFLEGAVRWSQPWSLFVLLRWCERHRASI